ncbi:MAG: Rieske (2Fe-2S) protein [Spirosomaceae bacterium]|nr:Rieske (2Fe-2S) protein [Spirosomataceae bacterium]
MENSQLSRGQFLKQLGLSSGALMAFYCLGTVTACTSSNEEPSPTGTNNSGNNTGGNTSTKVDFTLDLTTADFSKLKTEGNYVYKDKIIVANIKGGTFVALSKACTHEGTDVQYRLSQNDFFCPNHGSEFSTTGAVEKSPAAKALTLYKTELDSSGNKLRVFEG